MDVPQNTQPHTRADLVSGWGVAVRLGIVSSIVSGLLVAAFAGHVDATVLICTVLAVCSVVGWASAERAPLAQPIRLRRR